MPTPVLVLLSGGLDSTLLATMALRRRRLGGVLTVAYGQANADAELAAAYRWIDAHEVAHHRMTVGLAGVSSAMHTGAGTSGPRILPGRNAALVSLAVNCAAAYRYGEVWIGANADDGKYPDCSAAFVRGMTRLAAPWGVRVRAPLLRLHKVDIVTRAFAMGVDVWSTWSCYQPNPRSGAPCGTCNACTLRANALRQYLAMRGER